MIPAYVLAGATSKAQGLDLGPSTEQEELMDHLGPLGSSSGISDWVISIKNRDIIRLVLAFWSTTIGAGSLLLPRTGAVLLPGTKPLHYSNSFYSEGVYPLNQALNLISFNAN